jgi:hypothetical protein
VHALCVWLCCGLCIQLSSFIPQLVLLGQRATSSMPRNQDKACVGTACNPRRHFDAYISLLLTIIISCRSVLVAGNIQDARTQPVIQMKVAPHQGVSQGWVCSALRPELPRCPCSVPAVAAPTCKGGGAAVPEGSGLQGCWV